MRLKRRVEAPSPADRQDGLRPQLEVDCSLAAREVIVTGTRGGVGVKRTLPLFVKAGDVVEVEVSQIGVLRNPVVNERAYGCRRPPSSDASRCCARCNSTNSCER